MTYTTQSGLLVAGNDPIRWNPPKGWFEARDGSLACPHRNQCVCPECIEANPECVPTFGACFWIATPEDRATLAAEFPADGV